MPNVTPMLASSTTSPRLHASVDHVPSAARRCSSMRRSRCDTRTYARSVVDQPGASPLVAADLMTSEGLGVSALTERCAALGIASLATVADVTACLEPQLACRVDHLLENTTPRLKELLGLGGVVLP